MTVIIVGIFAFTVVAFRMTIYFDLRRWHVSVGFFALALVLYALNAYLIKLFIKQRAPEFANDREWEHTAGLGVVPRWVSALGLLSISAAITALLPWIIDLFR